MNQTPDAGDTRATSPQHPAPEMPCACKTGGCGGGATVARLMPSFKRVRINGVEITQEAIAREMQHHPAPSVEAAWREAARALAVRELLMQEARRQAIDCQPAADENGRTETSDDAIVRSLLERVLQTTAPSEEECRRVYDADPRRFRTPDLFEASHILIEPECNDASGWATAESQARLIATEVGDDRNQFAAAARELSKCPSAHQNGSLGQIRRGELTPGLQDALERLQPGVTAREPVRSRFGWHVLRLDRRIEGRELPFELVRSKIEDMLEARAWLMSSAHYVAELARLATIEGIDITPDDTER